MFVSAGMEGERPARLNRGEADRDTYRRSAAPRKWRTNSQSLAKKRSRLLALFTTFSSLTAGADKKAEAGAGAATEFQFVSIDFCFQAWICDTALLYEFLVILMVKILGLGGIRIEVDISSIFPLQRGGFGRGRGQQPQ